VIGRSRECDIPIMCATVSGRHCQLELRDGHWWVRDLGSKNGTAVNGTKLPEQRIGPSDVLSMGQQRFILHYVPPEPPPRPAHADEDVDSVALEVLHEAMPPVPDVTERLPPAPPARPRAHLGELVPCGGGDTVILHRPDLLVGRHPKCDVCVPYASISGKHCKLTLQDGYWFVQDLASSNGTSVNGVLCKKKCLLPDSVLGLSKYRFTVRYTPTRPGPPPDDDDEENVFAQGLLERAGLAKLAQRGQLPGSDEDDDSQRRRYKLDDDGNA
jgi:adenylate cyclase